MPRGHGPSCGSRITGTVHFGRSLSAASQPLPQLPTRYVDAPHGATRNEGGTDRNYSIARRYGYGFTGEPPPGCICRCRCGEPPAALPVDPTVPIT